jgi:DNA (cytosine-5)-methyltransferase 1
LLILVTFSAVDIDTHALHTYKANLPQGEDKVRLYLGSVNNFLFDVISGCGRGNMPQRGDIELILAGSPCQGFSAANPQGHEAMKSLNNSALICTTISAIDFYRPKYAILENVPAMATDRKYRGNTVNISNQLMCALIGMGYQCRCLLLDAWNFGAPQLRTRLFIEIAAPGCILPSIPQGSHAHPLDVKGRAVGKTATNIKFAERSFDDLTAFPSVELKDFWGDLPKIGNSHLGVCIPFPDHKTYWTPNARDRQIMSRIPHSDAFASSTVWGRYPGYKYAFHKRQLMPEHLTPRFVPFEAQDSRFTRLSSDGLSPTITCVQAPQSRISGKTLHYDEDRALSNLEAKRAQGFFDSDVLIGKPHKAYRIIGNSVCRQVAYALGLSLKDALTRQTSQVTQMEQMEAEKASMQLEEKLSVDKGEPGLSALRKVKQKSNVELMVLIKS